jgi:hypothetical protein
VYEAPGAKSWDSIGEICVSTDLYISKDFVAVVIHARTHNAVLQAVWLKNTIDKTPSRKRFAYGWLSKFYTGRR